MKRPTNYKYYANREPGPIEERDRSFEGSVYSIDNTSSSLLDVFARFIGKSKEETIETSLNELEAYVLGRVGALKDPLSVESLTVMYFIQYIAHRSVMELRLYGKEGNLAQFVREAESLEEKYMQNEGPNDNENIKTFVVGWIKAYVKALRSNSDIMDVPHAMAFFQLSLLTRKRVQILNCTRASYNVKCTVGYEPFAYTLLDTATQDSFIMFHDVINKLLKGNQFINPTDNALAVKDMFRLYSDEWWKKAFRLSMFASVDYRAMNVDSSTHGEEDINGDPVVLMKGSDNKVVPVKVLGDRAVDRTLPLEPLLDYMEREEVVDPPSRIVDRTARSTSMFWREVSEMVKRKYKYDVQPFVPFSQVSKLLLPHIDNTGLDFRVVRLLYELCGRDMTLLDYVIENAAIALEGRAEKREKMTEDEGEDMELEEETSGAKRKRKEKESGSTLKTLFQACLYTLERAYSLRTGSVAYHLCGVSENGKDVLYGYTLRSDFTTKVIHHVHVLFRWNEMDVSEEKVIESDTWKEFPSRMEKVQRSYWDNKGGKEIETLIGRTLDGAILSKNGVVSFTGPFLPRDRIVDLVGLWVDAQKKRKGGDPRLLPTYIGDRGLSKERILPGNILEAISRVMSNSYLEESPFLRLGQLNARMLTTDNNMDKLLGQYIKRTEYYERVRNSEIGLREDVVELHKRRVTKFKEFFQTKAGEKPPKTELEKTRDRIEAIIENGGEKEEEEGDNMWNPFYVEERLEKYFSSEGYKPPPFLIPRRISEDFTQYMRSRDENPFVEVELIPVVKKEKYSTKFIKSISELWLKRIITGLEYYTVEGKKVTNLNVSILIVWSQTKSPWVLNVTNSEEGGKWLRLIMSDPFNGGEVFYPYIESGPIVFKDYEVPPGSDVAPLRRSRSVFSLPFSADFFVTGIPKKMATYLRGDTRVKTLRKFRWKKEILDALYNEPTTHITKRLTRNDPSYAKKTSRLKGSKMRRLFALMGHTSVRASLEERMVNIWDLLGFFALQLGNKFPSTLLEGNIRSLGRDLLRDRIYRIVLYCASALQLYANTRINRGMWWRDRITKWVNMKDSLEISKERVKKRIEAVTKSDKTVIIHGPLRTPQVKHVSLMYAMMSRNMEFVRSIANLRKRSTGEDIHYVLGERIKMSGDEIESLKEKYRRFFLIVEARKKMIQESLKTITPIIHKGEYKIRGEDSKDMKEYITTKHENVEGAINAFYSNPELYPITSSKLPRKRTLIEKMDIRTNEVDVSYIGWGDQLLSDVDMRKIMTSELFESDPTEYYKKRMDIIMESKSASSITVNDFNAFIERAIMTARYLRQKMWVPFYSPNIPSWNDMERQIPLEDVFQCVVRADFVFTALYTRIMTYGGREAITGEDMDQWDNMQMNSSPVWKIRHGLRYHNLTKVPIKKAGAHLSDEIFQSFRRYVRYIGDTMFRMYVDGGKEVGWELSDSVKREELMDVHLLPKEASISSGTTRYLMRTRKTIGSLLFSLLFSGEVYHILQGPKSKDVNIPMRFRKRCDLLNRWATFKIPSTKEKRFFDSTHYHPLDPGMFYTPVWSNVLMRGEGVTGGSFREHTNKNVKRLIRGADDVNEYPYSLDSSDEERNPFVQKPRVFLVDMWSIVPACYIIHYTGNPFKGYGCYFDFRTGIRQVPYGRRKKGALAPQMEERKETKMVIGKSPLTYDAIAGCDHVGYSVNYAGVFIDWRTAARSDVDRQSDKAVVVDPVNHNEYTRKVSGTKITANIWKALVDYKIMLSQVIRTVNKIRQRGDIHSESFPVMFERPRKMLVDVVVSKGIVDAFSFGNETRFFNQGLSNVIDVDVISKEQEKIRDQITKLRRKLRKECSNEKRDMMEVRLEELDNKRLQLQIDKIYAKRIEEDFDNLKDSNTEMIFFASTACTSSVRDKLTPIPRSGAKKKVDLYTFPYIDGDTELYLSLEDDNFILMSRQETPREPGNVKEVYSVGRGNTAPLEIKGEEFISYLTIYDNDYPRCGIFIQLLMNVKTGFEVVWDYGDYYWLVSNILFTYPPNHFFGTRNRDQMLKKIQKWLQKFREEIEIKNKLPEIGETDVERSIVNRIIDADDDDYEIVIGQPGEEDVDPEMDEMGKQFIEKMKKARLELTEIRESTYMREDKEFVRELKRKREELFKYVRDNYPNQYNHFRQAVLAYEDTSSLLRLFGGDRKYQRLVKEVIEIEEKKAKIVREEVKKRGTLKWFTDELNSLSDEDALLKLKLDKNKQLAKLRGLEEEYMRLIRFYKENEKQVQEEIKKTSERDKLNELEKELKSIQENIEEETRKMSKDAKVMEIKTKIKELDAQINQMKMDIEGE